MGSNSISPASPSSSRPANASSPTSSNDAPHDAPLHASLLSFPYPQALVDPHNPESPSPSATVLPTAQSYSGTAGNHRPFYQRAQYRPRSPPTEAEIRLQRLAPDASAVSQHSPSSGSASGSGRGIHEYYNPKNQEARARGSSLGSRIGSGSAESSSPYGTGVMPNTAVPMSPLDDATLAVIRRGTASMGSPIPVAELGENAAPVDCPTCRARSITATTKVAGGRTHALAAGLLCLAFVPYLKDGTKDVEHRCGNCGRMLAKWHRSGRTELIYNEH